MKKFFKLFTILINVRKIENKKGYWFLDKKGNLVFYYSRKYRKFYF